MGSDVTLQTTTSPETVSASRRAFLRGRAHAAIAPVEAATSAAPFKPVISESCLALRGVDCRVCGEVCGEGAIRFHPRLGGVAQPVLTSDACTACGDCIAPCPAGALGQAVAISTVEGVAA